MRGFRSEHPNPDAPCVDPCIFLHFFAVLKNTSPVFSSKSTLFAQKHRGWGYPQPVIPSPARDLLSSRHSPLATQIFIQLHSFVYGTRLIRYPDFTPVTT
jgi:hypothetical protein